MRVVGVSVENSDEAGKQRQRYLTKQTTNQLTSFEILIGDLLVRFIVLNNDVNDAFVPD